MSDKPTFVYANAMDLAVSPYDFCLRFIRNEANNMGAGNPPDVIKADSVVVAMSPAHAKAMLPSLYRAVLEYERQFGKIGLMQDMLDDFNKTFKDSGAGT